MLFAFLKMATTSLMYLILAVELLKQTNKQTANTHTTTAAATTTTTAKPLRNNQERRDKRQTLLHLILN